jgi:hypothetical protein
MLIFSGDKEKYKTGENPREKGDDVPALGFPRIYQGERYFGLERAKIIIDKICKWAIIPYNKGNQDVRSDAGKIYNQTNDCG